MEFDNSFEVSLPPDQAWAMLTDIRRIAPCMPGAELTDVIDDRTYKGKIAVRLGPVALAFAGTVKFDEMDAAGHRARVTAQGSDAKGRGGANAAAAFRLEPAGAGTKVLVHTDLTLSGAVAQYGRGVGIIKATASQIIGQFARNLAAQLAARENAEGSAAEGDAGLRHAGMTSNVAGAPPMETALPRADPPTGPARPISGLSLMARVLWSAIVRLFTGRSPAS